MPEHYGALSPLLHVVPLQLLAYRTACARGRMWTSLGNLGQSVTVEDLAEQSHGASSPRAGVHQSDALRP